MTILNRLLTFNKPQKQVPCCQCGGTGKVKTMKTEQSTNIFCFFVCGVIVASALSLGTTKRLWIMLPLFLISSIVGIMILAEYKEQRKGVR
jgi:Na+/glutamate symporter